MFHRTLISCLAIVLVAGAAGAAEPVEVLLKGHDESLTGYLRQISDARFLLQGDNVYHEFPGNQIVTVDGSDDIPQSVRGNGRLIFSSFYEKILPGGDVEVWSHNQVTNDGVQVLTGTDWGAAAWEEEQIRTMEVYDSFNHKLPMMIVPRGDGGFTVKVDFIVPVAPRESLGLTLKTIRKGQARRTGDTWSYTFNIDFNEDRYMTRKIELPAGAEIEKTYAWCRKFDIEGRTILISQRYYPARTADPLTVVYKLP
ncbi:MAG: hypothetical protein ABFS42_09775 [Candidatus Krumholzibacteriota bacterium]